METNNQKNDLTTRTLENAMTEVSDLNSLNDYFDKVDQAVKYDSFLSYFNSLEKVRTQTNADIQKKSGIERTYCCHILDGTKDNPGRDKIIRLCLAAGLDDVECRRALDAGGVKAFYSKSRRDAVIVFALKKHLSVNDTNELLFSYGQEQLA